MANMPIRIPAPVPTIPPPIPDKIALSVPLTFSRFIDFSQSL